MNKTTAGWTTFIVALGMMCGLLASDVGKLTSWNQAIQPAFVAIVMAHFGAIVLAFSGGKMIPTTREPGMKTRSTDIPEGDK